jgi:hypothetical protein
MARAIAGAYAPSRMDDGQANDIEYLASHVTVPAIDRES